MEFDPGRGLPSPWSNADPEGEISLSYMDTHGGLLYSTTFAYVR